MKMLIVLGSWLTALALCAGQAQTLTLGAYGRLTPDYLTPTLELSYPLDDFTLGARAQRDAFGVSVERVLDLGAAGRAAYGARGSLGLAGWGAEGFVRGGVAQFALEARLGYAPTARSNLWVGDSDPAGLGGLLSGRVRLSSAQTAGLLLAYADPLLTAEATLALRDRATYTFGLGVRGPDPYAVLGWRGEVGEEGALLEALLRAGLRNELEAALSLPVGEGESILKLRLALAYALASSRLTASLGAELDSYRLDASYDGGFGLWLRYTLNLGGP